MQASRQMETTAPNQSGRFVNPSIIFLKISGTGPAKCPPFRVFPLFRSRSWQYYTTSAAGFVEVCGAIQSSTQSPCRSPRESAGRARTKGAATPAAPFAPTANLPRRVDAPTNRQPLTPVFIEVCGACPHKIPSRHSSGVQCPRLTLQIRSAAFPRNGHRG